MICRAYLNEKFFELNINEKNVLSYWYTDPVLLLEIVRINVKQLQDTLPSFFDEKYNLNQIRYIFSREKTNKYYIYGFQIGSSDMNEHKLFIICADDPEKVYNSIIVNMKNLEWRDYVLYRTYKAIILNNYLNSEGLKELNEAYYEIIELLNDIIDYFDWHKNLANIKDFEIKSSYLFALYHIVFPAANGILLNFLAGYVPVCFILLRLIIESLAVGLVIDCEQRFKDVNIITIEEWDEYIKNRKISISKLLKERLKRCTGSDDIKKAHQLWRRLSRKYVHFKGYAERIKERARKFKSPVDILPPDMIAVPIQIDESATLELKEFKKVVSQTREILQKLHIAWLKLVKSIA